MRWPPTTTVSAVGTHLSPSTALALWRVSMISVVVSMAGFVCGAVVGVLNPPPFSLEDLSPAHDGLAVVDVFCNNVTVALGLFFWGALTYCAGSAVLLALNGFLVGQLLRALSERDMLHAALPGLLPHGVTELGGFVLACTAGTLLAHVMVAALTRRPVGQPRIWLGLATALLFLAVALVGVSAFLEVHVSALPQVLR